MKGNMLPPCHQPLLSGWARDKGYQWVHSVSWERAIGSGMHGWLKVGESSILLKPLRKKYPSHVALAICKFFLSLELRGPPCEKWSQTKMWKKRMTKSWGQHLRGWNQAHLKPITARIFYYGNQLEVGFCSNKQKGPDSYNLLLRFAQRRCKKLFLRSIY